MPIDDVFFRSKAPVPKGCGPKRTDVAVCILCHRNAHDLDLGGVRLEPQLPSFFGNLAGQVDITLAQSPIFPGGGAHGDPLGSHVHVGEWPTAAAAAAIAATNLAASANDPTRK